MKRTDHTIQLSDIAYKSVENPIEAVVTEGDGTFEVRIAKISQKKVELTCDCGVENGSCDHGAAVLQFLATAKEKAKAPQLDLEQPPETPEPEEKEEPKPKAKTQKSRHISLLNMIVLLQLKLK